VRSLKKIKHAKQQFEQQSFALALHHFTNINKAMPVTQIVGRQKKTKLLPDT
jgi:hypothetical protein